MSTYESYVQHIATNIICIQKYYREKDEEICVHAGNLCSLIGILLAAAIIYMLRPTLWNIGIFQSEPFRFILILLLLCAGFVAGLYSGDTVSSYIIKNKETRRSMELSCYILRIISEYHTWETHADQYAPSFSHDAKILFDCLAEWVHSSMVSNVSQPSVVDSNYQLLRTVAIAGILEQYIHPAPGIPIKNPLTSSPLLNQSISDTTMNMALRIVRKNERNIFSS